jgi:hypothetical protein
METIELYNNYNEFILETDLNKIHVRKNLEKPYSITTLKIGNNVNYVIEDKILSEDEVIKWIERNKSKIQYK